MRKQLKKVMTAVLAVCMISSSLSPISQAADHVGTSDAAIAMYKNTYANLTDRITDRGYAPTSVTGAYQGMFIRDSSIQVMAQNAYGDYQKSRKVLNFLLSYQQGMGAEYAKHIVPDFDDADFDNTFLSEEVSEPVRETYYSEQTFTDHALFGMRSPNNGGGVSFQADSEELKSIAVFTNSTGKDVLTGSLRTKMEDASTEIACKNITITGTGWQTFTFEKPISVVKGQTYYFFVQADNGVAMFGKADGKPTDNAIMGYNYDIPVLGGFAQSAYPAFKINAAENENADHTFMSNTDYSIGLFLINASTNHSAFAFVPDTNAIRSFRVYLTGNAPAVFKLTTEPGNEAKTIKTISQEVTSNGWQTVDFGESIPVTPGQTYYVHIATTSGQVIAYGSTMFEKAVASMNWENNVWMQTGYVIAAEVFSEVNVAQKAYAQKISLNGDAIQSVSFRATAEKAGGNLKGELRESLNGEAIASGTAAITEAGTQKYSVDFGKEISVDSEKAYYFVLTAEKNDSVQWNYNPALKGSSYTLNEGKWEACSFDFGLNVLPLYSGKYRVPLISIGKKNVGVQEIPSFNEHVTAVDVLLGRNNDETGTAVATLYKGYGEGAVEVDSVTFDISELSEKGQMVHLEFGLPLEQVDKSISYYLEIQAPQNRENAITWYGTQESDTYETLCNGSKVDGEAGFAAYKSNLRALSDHVQIDGNYMLIHAWAQFVNGCEKTEENKQFIEKSYPIIKRFADYYIDNGYISEEYNLMRNDSFEHSREGRYWKSYDLITNVFASQALYELGALAEQFGDKTSAGKWSEASSTLTEGINEYLVTEIDGVKIYAELYDMDAGMKFIKGMSWVNWAPVAAEWYAMDKTIMQNTYDIYAKYDSQDYDGYKMLDVVYDFETKQCGNHIIGKGLAWEIMFNRYKEDYEKLDYLTQFVLDHSTAGGVYPETYQPNGHFSDVGNQEHASWQHYGMSYAFPELTKTYSIEKLQAFIEETTVLLKSQYTEDTWEALQETVKAAPKGFENLSKDEVDEIAEAITEAIAALQQKPIEEMRQKYTVTVNGEVKGTEYAYNDPVTVKAPEAEAGKVFAGWEINGKVVSLDRTYQFYVSNDVEITALFADDGTVLEEKAEAMMTNVIVTKREDTNSDIKFVGQIALPEGYQLKKAGLVWSTKDAAKLSLENEALVPTYIKAISTSNQFSVTIKGLPKTMFIRGRIFAVVQDKEGNEKVIYSTEKKAVAVK